MSGLFELLWPSSCIACGTAGVVACGSCLASLRRPPRVAWPDPAPVGLPPPYAVADYAGAARALLLAYKEDGVGCLRRPLATALAAALATAASSHDARVLVVPAPSTPAASRRRGENVVDALARAAVRQLSADPPLRVVSALRHIRRVADSAGLSSVQRADNLAGAFSVRARARRALDGATVVVADDLITTGATVAEATRALTAAGAHVVAAASIAATRRRAEVGRSGLHNADEGHYGAR